MPEADATRNLELILLLRGLRPDYKTIADFRRDNRGAFKAVFRAFVVLCRKLDLFGRELLAVDGTRLKAVNNPGRNFSRAKLARYIAAADERFEGYLAELDAIDRGEDGHGPSRSEALAAKIARVREQRQVQAAMLEQLNASGESQISLTAPDARAMVTGQKTTVGYNAQVAVDAKHKLIVEQHVTSAATDMGLLASTAGAAVAGMGYYKGEDIEACEASGITPYFARPERGSAVANGRLPKERFAYAAEANACRCPGGQLLDTRYRSVTNGHVSI
jgi:transposase